MSLSPFFNLFPPFIFIESLVEEQRLFRGTINLPVGGELSGWDGRNKMLGGRRRGRLMKVGRTLKWAKVGLGCSLNSQRVRYFGGQTFVPRLLVL